MISLLNRLNAYERLLRLHQPSGALLLLWPILSALWLTTSGWPPISLVIIFVMGTLLMRSAGCALADWLDRNNAIHGSSGGDGVPHKVDTRAAPLKKSASARGVIAPWEALVVAAVLALASLGFIWFTAPVAIDLSVGALVLALALAVLQHRFRRVLSLPQAAFAFVFLLGIPMTFATANHPVSWFAWSLVGIHVFWVLACDIEAAMANRDEDTALGWRSSALLLGRYDVPAVAVCYGLFLVGMALVGRWWHLGMAYWIALAVAAAGMVFFLWFIRRRKPSRCAATFRHQQWIVMVIFIGIVVDYTLRLHAMPMLGR
ncbi:MAG: UbiA family prenyltransferase [Betaproteobacteria bacterium]|nr:UbiA family prenyltransferase [Betaproteobacteria bacterium]